MYSPDGILHNRVLELMLERGHQSEWVELFDIALEVLDSFEEDIDAESLTTLHPHEVHRHPAFTDLYHMINENDGKIFDMRVGFRGLHDAVRLKVNIFTSIKSLPALSWKERVYEYLVDEIHDNEPTFHEDYGIDIAKLVNVPRCYRPQSLKLCSGVTSGGRNVETASDSELLRTILEQDRRFVVKFPKAGRELFAKRAAKAAHSFNKTRSTVLITHRRIRDFDRTDFSAEFAVHLAVDPVYILRFSAVSGSPSDSLTDITGGQDGRTDSASVCGCGAVLTKMNVFRTTRGIVECEEHEIWRFRRTVGNNALRQVGEYRALVAGLKVCVDQGLYPVRLQSWSYTVHSHAKAMVYAEGDTSKLNYSELKRYKRPEPEYSTHLCIPLFAEAKRLMDLLQTIATDTHYNTPHDYNILGLPDERRTDNRVWKVSWAASDFKRCGNGTVRPMARVVPWRSNNSSSAEYTAERKNDVKGTRGSRAASAPALEPEQEHELEEGHFDTSAWEGHVKGTALGVSMTEPLLPPVCFERIPVEDPRLDEALAEASKARTEGFMLDRGWSSKCYVDSERDEGWTQNRKFAS
jgi:hypothetical protein